MMRIFVFFGGIFSGHEKIENSPIINPQQLLLLLHTKNNFVFVSSSSNVFLVHLCCRSALGERYGRPLLDGGTAMLFQDGPLATKMRSPFIKLRAVSPVSCSYGYRGPPFE
jgi:hypothetical protein